MHGWHSEELSLALGSTVINMAELHFLPCECCKGSGKRKKAALMTFATNPLPGKKKVPDMLLNSISWPGDFPHLLRRGTQSRKQERLGLWGVYGPAFPVVVMSLLPRPLSPDVLRIMESVVCSGTVQVTIWIKSSSVHSCPDPISLFFSLRNQITPLKVWLQLGSPEVKTEPVSAVQENAMCWLRRRDPWVDYS